MAYHFAAYNTLLCFNTFYRTKNISLAEGSGSHKTSFIECPSVKSEEKSEILNPQLFGVALKTSKVLLNS